MKKILLLLIVCLVHSGTKSQEIKQTFKLHNSVSHSVANEDLQMLYSPLPNHRKIVLQSFELALSTGFVDTSGITLQEIRDRLEAGAYSEDFEAFQGIMGDHFPNPWNEGPDFDFGGDYSFSKIPYGSYRNASSGWYRGLNHGYDPIQNLKWPGANFTSIEWANYSGNSYNWSNAVQLYLSGEKAKAYQCLGHILHLLADLSVPSHVKVVNHGMDVVELNSGSLIDPDKLELIVDEYEMAISGGILVPGIVFIPDLLSEFQSALILADSSNIPELPLWEDYLRELGEYTYGQALVNQFYVALNENGGWGAALDENGTIKDPTTYATLPLVEINGDWFELKIKSTATSTGTILPESKIVDLCNNLVPKTVEYGAGLIKHFYQIVTEVKSENIPADNFLLFQNFPNPFNPKTVIKFSVPSLGYTTLKIFNTLGEEVAVIIDKELTTGTYKAEWDAAGLPSGVYFYQLKAENFIETKKMVLMK